MSSRRRRARKATRPKDSNSAANSPLATPDVPKRSIRKEDRAPLYPTAATPISWRIGIVLAIVAIYLIAFFSRDIIGTKGQSIAGIFCFIGIAAAISTNLRAVRWKTVVFGLGLQFFFGLLMLQGPAVANFVDAVAQRIDRFLSFSIDGAKFVFGPLADRKVLAQAFGPNNGFVFAFAALPPILFISAFFSVLYHFGILQFIVGLMARLMRGVMGTSGAESLSAAANVFMGQTEAPLIVKPYVRRMTRSEMLALMVGGMATVSGGMMAVYISIGADAKAILITSVMAAPAGLYIAKLLIPETQVPETRDFVKTKTNRTSANFLDAASRGTSDGLQLALNVAAMLVVFVGFVSMINALLQVINPTWTLQGALAPLFQPVAFLMGVVAEDTSKIAGLLGTKLVVNELVAFLDLQAMVVATNPEAGLVSARSQILATYALTGFANFASIGIQLGGIGAMAPKRRSQLAKLGLMALVGGTLATLINACIAGLLIAS
ncbi:NupC/NupG family nucleoside CNT transporter [Tuwongella immobilis]|uniref:Na+ dependent nucleoside transporter domain-containing protein n=1 Tax=Tuwongella immobilis TaxID=692036 RepID=A0A6C2YQM7_9BACT|nr:nucleoside transporter C-terminal domain-containing protein [Tuwongella immobilis]VIP03305.1 Nucleoside transporter, NupC family OS=Bacteriovorax sp. Seq25_V GN=M900_2087 PE=4 SV=1: Nucleos_tra2_N: Gate: Nucleos_tra2_C [Tuwongella immobilis]VTS03981.1 Nucleoside transporter, NupC family OS=Bacteriovorax sp. Seq25_V GN=M900_2087 PE=4 SV=1: Nucleos_tra2_N: Gate: Nucleos_tra2_C [Tuwongella immobilis]